MPAQTRSRTGISDGRLDELLGPRGEDPEPVDLRRFVDLAAARCSAPNRLIKFSLN